MLVRRIGRRRDEAGYLIEDEEVSVECPRCRLASRKSGDIRRPLGWLHLTTGRVILEDEPTRTHGETEDDGQIQSRSRPRRQGPGDPGLLPENVRIAFGLEVGQP